MSCLFSKWDIKFNGISFQLFYQIKDFSHLNIYMNTENWETNMINNKQSLRLTFCDKCLIKTLYCVNTDLEGESYCYK